MTTRIVLAMSVLYNAQLLTAQPVFPPVPGNDAQRSDYGLWSNPGWVLDTYGDLRPDVQFVTEGASPRTYIRRDASMSFTVATVDSSAGGADTLRRLDMELVGELSLRPDAIGSSARNEWRNYYLPHCGPNGVTNVIGYNRIVYENIYPQIDLWVFSGYYGQKMMFVVRPGGDPANIVMQFTGQDQLDVDANGWLKMLLGNKWIELPEATAYQYDQNNVITPMLWTADYEADENNGIVSFNFDSYNPAKPLVFLIGPPPPMMGGTQFDETGLCWSTYVGDDGDDYPQDLRKDGFGRLYVCGWTSSTLLQFPAEPGILHASSGHRVAFLTKFTAQHQLSWTVFHGGDLLSSTTEGNAIAIQEGPTQRIYMGGSTNAMDLWTMSIGNAFYFGTNSNTSHKASLIQVNDLGFAQWATYFGEHDVVINGMDVVQGPNKLVICGIAKENLPDVQVSPPSGALDLSYSGDWDAFIAEFDVNRQLFWRSWFGGTLADIGQAIRVTSDRIFLAGYSLNTDIAMMDPGGGAYYQSEGAGGFDCFLLEFDANGATQWSTYLGGTGTDILGDKGLEIGAGGDVYLCGLSEEFPMVHGPNWYDDVSESTNGFLARFSGVDRSPLWLTYLAGGGQNMVTAINEGPGGLINVVGYTQDHDVPYLPIAGLYDQDDWHESQLGSFLVQFTSDQQLYHGTWFGGDDGTKETWPSAITSDEEGVYSTGHIWKIPLPQSYWPLDDGLGTAWFDGDFNHLGQSVSGKDGFLTWFCSESSIGFEDAAPITTGGLELLIENERLLIKGLKDGSNQFSLFDAFGRTVLSGRVSSSAGRSEPMAIGPTPGFYVLSVNGERPVECLIR